MTRRASRAVPKAARRTSSPTSNGAGRSEGARLVAELVARAGATEFGRRVKTSEGMARHLAAGRRKPTAELRERIRAAWGVAPETWDRPAAAPPPAKPVTEEAPATPPAPSSSVQVSGLAELRATMALIDAHIRAALADEFASAASMVSLLRAKASAAEKLARLQGEGELTMAMIVRSRAWREVLALLRPILERHPEVATEIAEVLEALEGP